MHFLPQTKQGLIDWLKLPADTRVAHLRTYCEEPLNHYTSPLCVSTGQDVIYHVEHILAELHKAESILDLPYEVILFFPNYDILLAAFTVAKNKWDIHTATEYARSVSTSYWSFNDTLKGRAYPYIHWLPKNSTTIVVNTFTVTSAHYPFLGTRTHNGKIRAPKGVSRRIPKRILPLKPFLDEDEDL